MIISVVRVDKNIENLFKLEKAIKEKLKERGIKRNIEVNYFSVGNLFKLELNV